MGIGLGYWPGTFGSIRGARRAPRTSKYPWTRNTSCSCQEPELACARCPPCCGDGAEPALGADKSKPLFMLLLWQTRRVSQNLNSDAPTGRAEHLVRRQGLPSPLPLPDQQASSRNAQNLNSGIFPNGSSASFVSRFAAASLKQKGMNTWPGISPSSMRE